MTTGADPFPSQLAAACARYVEQQVDNGEYGGGWGLREGQEPSIVNTAEVLAIVKAQGLSGDPVDRAVTYLTRAIPLHCAKRELGKGRGRNTRFVTYGLLGLTEYEGRLSRPDVADTVRWAVAWLEEHRHEGGARGEQGWPEALGEEECSLFQTAMATIAVTRLKSALEQRGTSAPLPGEDEGFSLPHRLDLLIEHGVNGLLFHRLPNGAWPRQTFADKGSPAKTALAVLALAAAADRSSGAATGPGDDRECPWGGGPPEGGHITLAAAIDGGRDWLLENSARWQRFVEADPDVRGTVWSHLAYALGVRACVRACADPDDPRLHAARSLIDNSWSHNSASWTEPIDDNPLPTVRGSYNVVLAKLELRAAYGRVGRSPAPYRSPHSQAAKRAAHQLVLKDQAVTTVDDNGNTTVFSLSPRRFELVRLLASSEGVAVTVSKAKIATELGLAQTSVANAVAQANKAVLDATSGQVAGLIVSRGHGDESGYCLAVDQIRHLP
jgi:hypothetical protein